MTTTTTRNARSPRQPDPIDAAWRAADVTWDAHDMPTTNMQIVRSPRAAR